MSAADRQPALRPAVFLDRDGTLIDNDGDLGDPEQIQIDRSARLLLENLDTPNMAESAAEQLLSWLNIRVGEHE